MDDWRPRCTPPPDLVAPVPIDPSGRAGPTRHQARRGRWERVGLDLYVPAGTRRDRVEQRIIEQAGRVGQDGAVTGWAALRMWGAAFFDGTVDGSARIPVPLVCRRHLRPNHESTVSRSVFGEVWMIAGVRVVRPAEALYAELCRRTSLEDRVAAIDLACAAPVTSLARFTAWLDRNPGTPGSIREAVGLASEHAASPPEVRMRLVWVRDAGWASPLVNTDVYDPSGRFIGRPDLLDAEVGVFGEYSGALHRDRERHRSDVARMERLQAHGLEGFEIVAGDTAEVQLARMAAARQRALRRPASERRWIIDPSQGRRPEITADEVLETWGYPT